MRKIEQEVVYRKQGTYERFDKFIGRVTDKANEIAEDKSVMVLNISYPDEAIAVITYLKRGIESYSVYWRRSGEL